MLFQEAFQPPSAWQVACIEGKRQGQYQSFAYPILSEYSSENFAPRDSTCMPDRGSQAQNSTDPDIVQDSKTLPVMGSLCNTVCTTPKQNKLGLYIHYRGWHQHNSFATPSVLARTFPFNLMLVYNATYCAVLQHHVVVS